MRNPQKFSFRNQSLILGISLVFALLHSTSLFAEVAFFGRDFKTYVDMFCFSPDEVEDPSKRILDVAAGPSTFLGDLRVRNLLHPDSRAFDREYPEHSNEKSDLSSNLLKEAIDRGMRQAFAPYYDESYKKWPALQQASFEEKHKIFSTIHETFVAYFQKFPELYVRGDIITDLPSKFKDQKFDLILSSNLLFLYHQVPGLNKGFHLQAILNMAGLLSPKGELRLFPLDDFELKNPEFLPDLIQALKQSGLTVERKPGCAPSAGQHTKRRPDLRGEMLVIRLNAR